MGKETKWGKKWIREEVDGRTGQKTWMVFSTPPGRLVRKCRIYKTDPRLLPSRQERERLTGGFSRRTSRMF